MASQGETGQDTTSLSLDVMGTQAQTIISLYTIIRGALWSTRGREQCLGVQKQTSMGSLSKALIMVKTHLQISIFHQFPSGSGSLCYQVTGLYVCVCAVMSAQEHMVFVHVGI